MSNSTRQSNMLNVALTCRMLPFDMLPFLATCRIIFFVLWTCRNKLNMFISFDTSNEWATSCCRRSWCGWFCRHVKRSSMFILCLFVSAVTYLLQSWRSLHHIPLKILNGKQNDSQGDWEIHRHFWAERLFVANDVAGIQRQKCEAQSGLRDWHRDEYDGSVFVPIFNLILVLAWLYLC